MHRREFLGVAGALAAAATLAVPSRAAALLQEPPPKVRGRIRHSVCRWCYGGIPLETLCVAAVGMGISSIEILDEPDWAVVKKHGLTCAMANGPSGITEAWNRAEHHEQLVQRSEELLPRIAAAGLPSMIVFSGNRAGQADAEGARQCIAGLRRIAPLAEKLGVDVQLEILNSKVDHPDYQFDHMRYGVDVIEGVASPRVKILYDIYHAQIMEGDVIATIREHAPRIGHFHTGGVPGRHEIDATQELNYAAICRAIADTGFTGFVSQEFVPVRDPLTSLKEAIAICDV
jgi:hydroxypyruvate isomerase